MMTIGLIITSAHRGWLPELFDYYSGDFIREHTEGLYRESVAVFFPEEKKGFQASRGFGFQNMLDLLTREPRYLYTKDLMEALSEQPHEVPPRVRDDLYSMASFPALVEWIKNPRGQYASIFQYEFIRQLDSYSYLQEVAIYNSEKKHLWRKKGKAQSIPKGGDWEHITQKGFSIAIKERGRTIGYIRGPLDALSMESYPEIAHPGLGVFGAMISSSSELLFPETLPPVLEKLFSRGAYIGPLAGEYAGLRVMSMNYGGGRVLFFYPAPGAGFYLLRIFLYSFLIAVVLFSGWLLYRKREIFSTGKKRDERVQALLGDSVKLNQQAILLAQDSQKSMLKVREQELEKLVMIGHHLSYLRKNLSETKDVEKLLDGT